MSWTGCLRIRRPRQLHAPSLRRDRNLCKIKLPNWKNLPEIWITFNASLVSRLITAASDSVRGVATDPCPGRTTDKTGASGSVGYRFIRYISCARVDSRRPVLIGLFQTGDFLRASRVSPKPAFAALPSRFTSDPATRARGAWRIAHASRRGRCPAAQRLP